MTNVARFAGLILVLLSGISRPLHAADVVAPATGRVFTLTVKNFGSTDLPDVSVQVTTEEDPAEVITVHGISPAAAAIAAGHSGDFRVEFSAACPSRPHRFETARLRFSVASATAGPLYVKDCGLGKPLCAELEAEITVDTSGCNNRIVLEVAGVEDGKTYSSAVAATVTATDDSPALTSFAGTFGDAGLDDYARFYDQPLATDSASHAYRKHCSARSYAVLASAADQAGALADLALSFSIAGTQCPRCFDCSDSPWGAVCRQDPGARDCQPPIWSRPDDNVDLATNPPVEITTLASYDRSSPIGVLRSGYYDEMFKLMASFGAKAALVGIDFDPSIVEQVRVLVIPTGGLYGLNNSGLFRSALAEYANRGGTIVSLSQAYGDEFAALPGNPGGYGWIQDTACFSKAFYIERYHQFLSGQHIVQGTSDAEVDGYFTDLPLGALVYLRRTRNGQPGLIEYPYGFAGGRVFATTSYADWAFANGQAALDSRHLLRDILAWAFDPKELAEYRPGETSPARVLQVMHFGDGVPAGDAPATAELVRFSVQTPDRRLYLPMTVPAHVEAGTLVEAELPAFALPAESAETVGIWWVDYTLLDAAGGAVQDSVRHHRFVVSPSSVSPYQQKDFYFSIQTDSDAYPVGGRAVFTFLAFNNTARDRVITLRPDVGASEAMLVPAYGRTQVVRVLDPVRWVNSRWVGGGWVSAWFYDERGTFLDSTTKSFGVYVPAVELDLLIPRPEYGRGETVPIELRMLNKSPANQHNDYVFKLIDPSGSVILEQRYSFDSGPDAQRVETLEHPLAVDAPEGTYRASLEAFDDRGNKVATTSRTFSLAQTLLAVRPTWPAAWDVENAVGFDVRNIGASAVESAALTATITAPDGSIVWAGSAATRRVEPGESAMLLLQAAIPAVRVGRYTLAYELAYGGKVARGREDLPSSLQVRVLLERAEVTLNDTLRLKASLANEGRFRQTLTVTTAISDTGFRDSRALTLEPGGRETIELRLLMNASVPVGRHRVQVDAVLASGDVVSADGAFQVPAPTTAVVVSLESPSGSVDGLHVRDSVVPRIRLTASRSFVGALDARCRIEIPAAGHSETASVQLHPGETLSLPAGQDSFPRPLLLADDVPAGRHEVLVSLEFPNGYTESSASSLTIADSKLVLTSSGDTLSAGDVLSVSAENVGGVDADYAIEWLEIDDEDWNTLASASGTGRLLVGERRVLAALTIPAAVAAGDAYLYASVTDGHPQSYLLSKRIRIVGTSASLSVATGKEVFTKAEPVGGSTEIASDSGVEDGSLTIRVEHFNDGTGKEFRRAAPRDRYFNFGEPHGVGVAPDGSVYVASSWEHRIQKFDANGRLLAQWGTQGRGPGEFDWPTGIAIGPDGTVYVVDCWNCRIQKFSPNGHYISSWGTYGQGDGQLNYPYSIAVGPNGDVFVADTGNRQVQRFDSSGNFIGRWPVTSLLGTLEWVDGIAVDQSGFVYVGTDSSIHKYDSDGNRLADFGCGAAEDLTVDANGYVYATDRTGDFVTKYDPDGSPLASWPLKSWEDGRGAAAYAIVASADDKLHVADAWYRVQRYTLDGSFLDEWKSCGGEKGRFGWRSPSDVGVFGPGWAGFFVLDRDNDRILRFTDDGDLLAQWGGHGTEIGKFQGPQSFFLSAEPAIYVADTGNDRIQVLSGDGRFARSWGSSGTGEGQLRSPTGIAQGPEGTIYVVDAANSRVQRFTSHGEFLGMWGSAGSGDSQFSSPERVAVDAGGNVYVTDKNNHRVQKFDAYGAFLGTWGTYGTGDGQFDLPTGIAVTPEGNVLVVDSCSTNRNDLARNNRVMEFDNQGNFIRSWGASLGDPRSWDARGSVGDANGLFNRPEGVAVGPDGSIYVADSGNRRVQRLSRTAGYETVFEMVTPLVLATGTTASYPFNAGLLDMAGQMNVVATLSNSLGQELASAQHPFFIVDNEISIAFATDKTIYRPGEAVLVRGEARNRTDQPVEGVLVTVSQGTAIVSAELVDLPAGGAHEFAASLTALGEGTFLLSGSTERAGTVLSVANVGYEVATPVLFAYLYGPDVAGADPFAIELYLRNGCALPVTVTYSSVALGANGELALEPWEGTSLFFEPTIAAGAEFVVDIGGDVSQTVTKTVGYGLTAQVQVSAAPYYPEGRVNVPYTATNVGVLPGSYPVVFELFDADGNSVASSRFVHHLTVGDATAADAGIVGFDLTPGEYRLHHATIGSEGDTPIRVARPEARAILSASTTYPEGFVTMPILLENVGHVPGSFAVTTTVTSGIQVLREFTSSVFLNSPDDDPAAPGYAGTAHAAKLGLTLAPGPYRVRAQGAGIAGATVDFVVLPKVATALSVSAGATAAGRLPVAVSVLNNGTESFSGLIIAETGFWSGEAPVMAVPPNAAARRQFEVALAGAPPGFHLFTARLLDEGGNLLKQETAIFEVRGPVLRVSRLPDDATFAAGGSAAETVCVVNDGDQEGFLVLVLAAFEGSERLPASLEVGQERCFRFEFPVPDDIEEKGYDARYSLFRREEGVETLVAEGRIPFHVASVKVGVVAALDAKLYRPGETAHLTLDVSSVGTLSNRALLARVRFGDHEEFRAFTLSPSGNRLEFDVPVVSFEDRLLNEILMPTGRSLYINTLFVQERHDEVRLFTDRADYLPGDEVSVTVEADAPGTVEITALSGAFARSFAMAPGSPLVTNFTLPADICGGTHLITYTFGGAAHGYRFNVASPRVEFLDARLDKARYGSGAPFRASFEVLTGAEIDGWVDGYFEGPDGLLSPAFSYRGRFVAGVTAFEVSGLVAARQTGLHKLYALFYAGAAGSRALTSATEFFDVGTFALTQVLTDRARYREGLDPVVLTAYLAGEAFGFLSVALDGQEVLAEPVSVVGFTQVALTIPAGSISGPGAHVARVSLRADNGESTKEVAFEVRKRPAPPVLDSLPGLTNSTTLDFAGLADPRARIALRVNGVEIGSAAAGADGRFLFPDVQLPLEGANLLEAVAWDDEGTESAHTTAAIERDTVAPVVTISSPQPGMVSTSTPVLQFTATDGAVTVIVDDAPAAVAGGQALGPFADGEHRVEVSATDLAGNTGSASVTFSTSTVKKVNRAPELSTPGNVNVAEGETLRFALTGTDPDGDTVSLAALELPEGAGFNPRTGVFEWTPGFAQEGEYEVTFRASDDGVPALSVDRTIVISVVSPAGPIFADDFADGAAPEDWVWGSGSWTAAGGVYIAGSVKATNLVRIVSIEPPAAPLLAGVIQVRVKLTSKAARSGSNGMFVFAYQNPSQYRWVKITRTQVQIGQTGSLGNVGAGVKKKVVKRQPVNRFQPFTVKVFADGWVKVYKGTGTAPLVSYQFANAASGGVGLASFKARTVFDDLFLFDDSRL